MAEPSKRDLSPERLRRIEAERNKSQSEKDSKRLERRKLDAAKRVAKANQVDRLVAWQRLTQEQNTREAFLRRNLQDTNKALSFVEEKIAEVNRELANNKGKYSRAALIDVLSKLEIRRRTLSEVRSEQMQKDRELSRERAKGSFADKAPKKTPVELEANARAGRPAETSVERRVKEIKERMRFESLDSLDSILDALSNQIRILKNAENVSEKEAIARVFSELQLKVEQRAKTIIDRFNDGRATQDELREIADKIDSILANRRIRSDLPALGRLESLLGKIETAIRLQKPRARSERPAPEIGDSESQRPPSPEPGPTPSPEGPSGPVEPIVTIGPGDIPPGENRNEILDAIKRLSEQVTRFETNVNGKFETVISILRGLEGRVSNQTYVSIVTNLVDVAIRKQRTDVLNLISANFGRTLISMETNINTIIQNQTRQYTEIISVVGRSETKVIAEVQKVLTLVNSQRGDINTIMIGIQRLERFFLNVKNGQNAFENILTQIVKNGNRELVKQLEGRYGEIIKRIGRVRSDIKILGEELKKLLEGLNKEGKANQEKVEELLKQLEIRINTNVTAVENRLVEKLDKEVLKILIDLEKFFDPVAFGDTISYYCQDAIIAQRPAIVEAIMEEFGARYPDIKDLGNRLLAIEEFLKNESMTKADRDLIRGDLVRIMAELKSSAKGIGHGLGNIIARLEKMERFFDADNFAVFLDSALREVIAEEIFRGNKKVLDAIVAANKNTTRVKNLVKELIAKEQAHFEELKEKIKGLKEQGVKNTDEILNRMWEAYKDLLRNGAENKEEILDRLWEVYQDLGKKGEKNTQDILAKIQDLKDYFSTDAYKKIIKDIVDQALLDNNPVLVDAIKAALPDMLKDVATKSDIEKILKELEEIKNGKGKDGKDGKDGEDGGGKKPEEKPKEPSPWKNVLPRVATFGGMALIALAIAAIIIGIMRANNASDGATKVISITPVIGETAKTAATSGSLLGSLGGINPLIIILILVALFLLFPKK